MTCRFSPALAALLVSPMFVQAASPLAQYGQISVREGRLVGEFTGKPSRLAGMSLGNLDNQEDDQSWSPPVVDWLATDWGCSMVRVTLDISRADVFEAYRNNPNLAKGKIHQLIQAAIEKGIYVAVVWHEDSLSDHPAEAKAFFEEMALVYGDKPNLLFEPYDGLTGNAYDWNRLRELHTEILSVIRPYSSNPVLISTPNKSRESDAVLGSPLEDSNVLYSQHLDTESDETWDRERMIKVVGAKLPLFVSRLATSTSGEPEADLPKTARWKGLLDSLGVSWCGWSISTVGGHSATLDLLASPSGGWAATDLTASGEFFRSALLSDSQTRARIDTFAIPGKLAAKSFVSVGFDHVVRGVAGEEARLELLPGSWAEYVAAATAPIASGLVVRGVASSAGILTLKLQGREIARIAVPASVAGASPAPFSVDSVAFMGGAQRLRLEWTSDDTGRLQLDQWEARLPGSPVRHNGSRSPKWRVYPTASGLEARLPAGSGPVRIQIANPQGRILADRLLDREATQIGLAERGILVIRMQDASGASSWTLLR
ncbi:MAG: cellulase family glycosylhydrolase [Fibrobacteres bacterium]|nr:cellulase family glycosylhydrolase [Fibrobacterota bacterium]